MSRSLGDARKYVVTDAIVDELATSKTAYMQLALMYYNQALEMWTACTSDTSLLTSYLQDIKAKFFTVIYFVVLAIMAFFFIVFVKRRLRARECKRLSTGII